MKKIITLLTVLTILLLACCPLYSRAAEIERKADVSLRADKTTVEKGDTVTFSVIMNQLPEGYEKVYGIDFNLSFDENFFENYRQPDEGEDFEISGGAVHVVKGTSASRAGATLYSFQLDVKSSTTLTSGSVTLTDNTAPGAGSLSDGDVDVYFLQESYTATVSLESENPDDPEEPPTPGTVAVTGISVTPTQKELTIGETLTIQATVSPSNATNKAITWSSSNSSIASVSSSGVVTAKAEGAATITAKTNDGNKQATCVITVVKTDTPDTPGSEVKVTGVAIDKTTASVKTEGKVQLNATVAPSNATNKNVTWTSSDPSIATVDSKGLVTGIKAGTVQITVRTVDGGMTAVTTVVVTNEDVVIDIEDNKSSSGSSSSGSSSSKSGTDSTTAKDKIPQTGETFIVVAGLIALSSVAVVSYRKIKANKDI